MFYCTVAVILYLATTTMQIKVVENMWDKANHFTAFFVLYIELTLAYERVSILNKFLYLLGFGIFIELVQYFIPGRFFSPMDVFADSIGIVLGIIFYRVLFSRKSQKAEE
jgi:VanZ family protein